MGPATLDAQADPSCGRGGALLPNDATCCCADARGAGETPGPFPFWFRILVVTRSSHEALRSADGFVWFSACENSQTKTGVRWDAPSFCHGLSCPEYTVVGTGVRNSHNRRHGCLDSRSRADRVSSPPQSSFEVRKYEPTVWVSTVIEEVDFDAATNVGFHRLFDYISGNNEAATKIPMTARSRPWRRRQRKKARQIAADAPFLALTRVCAGSSDHAH